MIDPQRKTSCQLRYGLSFYLLSSTLMMSVTTGSAVAGNAGKTVGTTKEVTFFETTIQTNDVELDENLHLADFVFTVERGDSLSSILRANLGSLSALREVTRYNNLETPDVLEPGQEILIPGYLFPNQPDAQPVQLVNLPGTLAQPESARQSTQPEEQYLVVDLSELNSSPDRKIRVNRGDSLSSILRENLGSLSALREVTRYNNLETPDVLEPGQIILIPGYL